MQRFRCAPWWWAVGGAVALFAIGLVVAAVAGAAGRRRSATCSSRLCSCRAASAGSGSTRFGAANAVTATRSTLVGVVTALVVTSSRERVPLRLPGRARVGRAGPRRGGRLGRAAHRTA